MFDFQFFGQQIWLLLEQQTAIGRTMIFLLVFSIVSWIIGINWAAKFKLQALMWSSITGLTLGFGMTFIQYSWNSLGLISRGTNEVAFFLTNYLFIYIFYSFIIGSFAYVKLEEAESHPKPKISFLGLTLSGICAASLLPLIPHMVEPPWQREGRTAMQLCKRGNADKAVEHLNKVYEELNGSWPKDDRITTSITSDQLDYTVARAALGMSDRKKANELLDRFVALRIKNTSNSIGCCLFLADAARSYCQLGNYDAALRCLNSIDVNAKEDRPEWGQSNARKIRVNGLIALYQKKGQFDKVDASVAELPTNEDQFLVEYANVLNWYSQGDQKPRAIKLFKTWIADKKMTMEEAERMRSWLAQPETYGPDNKSDEIEGDASK